MGVGGKWSTWAVLGVAILVVCVALIGSAGAIGADRTKAGVETLKWVVPAPQLPRAHTLSFAGSETLEWDASVIVIDATNPSNIKVKNVVDNAHIKCSQVAGDYYLCSIRGGGLNVKDVLYTVKGDEETPPCVMLIYYSKETSPSLEWNKRGDVYSDPAFTKDYVCTKGQPWRISCKIVKERHPLGDQAFQILKNPPKEIKSLSKSISKVTCWSTRVYKCVTSWKALDWECNIEVHIRTAENCTKKGDVLYCGDMDYSGTKTVKYEYSQSLDGSRWAYQVLLPRSGCYYKKKDGTLETASDGTYAVIWGTLYQCKNGAWVPVQKEIRLPIFTVDTLSLTIRREEGTCRISETLSCSTDARKELLVKNTIPGSAWLLKNPNVYGVSDGVFLSIKSGEYGMDVHPPLQKNVIYSVTLSSDQVKIQASYREGYLTPTGCKEGQGGYTCSDTIKIQETVKKVLPVKAEVKPKAFGYCLLQLSSRQFKAVPPNTEIKIVLSPYTQIKTLKRGKIYRCEQGAWESADTIYNYSIMHPYGYVEGKIKPCRCVNGGGEFFCICGRKKLRCQGNIGEGDCVASDSQGCTVLKNGQHSDGVLCLSGGLLTCEKGGEQIGVFLCDGKKWVKCTQSKSGEVLWTAEPPSKCVCEEGSCKWVPILGAGRILKLAKGTWTVEEGTPLAGDCEIEPPTTKGGLVTWPSQFYNIGDTVYLCSSPPTTLSTWYNIYKCAGSVLIYKCTAEGWKKQNEIPLGEIGDKLNYMYIGPEGTRIQHLTLDMAQELDLFSHIGEPGCLIVDERENAGQPIRVVPHGTVKIVSIKDGEVTAYVCDILGWKELRTDTVVSTKSSGYLKNVKWLFEVPIVKDLDELGKFGIPRCPPSLDVDEWVLCPHYVPAVPEPSIERLGLRGYVIENGKIIPHPDWIVDDKSAIALPWQSKVSAKWSYCQPNETKTDADHFTPTAGWRNKEGIIPIGDVVHNNKEANLYRCICDSYGCRWEYAGVGTEIYVGGIVPVKDAGSTGYKGIEDSSYVPIWEFEKPVEAMQIATVPYETPCVVKVYDSTVPGGYYYTWASGSINVGGKIYTCVLGEWEEVQASSGNVGNETEVTNTASTQQPTQETQGSRSWVGNVLVYSEDSKCFTLGKPSEDMEKALLSIFSTNQGCIALYTYSKGQATSALLVKEGTLVNTIPNTSGTFRSFQVFQCKEEGGKYAWVSVSGNTHNTHRISSVLAGTGVPSYVIERKDNVGIYVSLETSKKICAKQSVW